MQKHELAREKKAVQKQEGCEHGVSQRCEYTLPGRKTEAIHDLLDFTASHQEELQMQAQK